MTKDGSSNVWKDATGNVMLTHNSPWRMELSDGSVIQLGEGFDPAQWGISLADAPAANTAVLNGDFVKTTDSEGKSYLLNDGNYVSTGQAQAGAADLITGTVAAQTINGLGGKTWNKGHHARNATKKQNCYQKDSHTRIFHEGCGFFSCVMPSATRAMSLRGARVALSNHRSPRRRTHAML